MRAHLVQMDLAWERREENIARAASLLENAGTRRGDLVVLPELFDSGFSLNTAVTADAEGRTDAALADLADRFGVTVQGGRTVRDEGAAKATNRAPVWAPGRTKLAEYAKVHPFSFGREPEAFDGGGGDQIQTYDWSDGERSMRVCPAICYDLRFPELFRVGLTLGAEAYTIGANWPAPRQSHWRALALARAIENQAFVFAVNRCGSDPHLAYSGGTIAVGPKGEVLGELGELEGVLTVEIDPEDVRRWRATFGAWRDLRLLGLEPPQGPLDRPEDRPADGSSDRPSDGASDGRPSDASASVGAANPAQTARSRSH